MRIWIVETGEPLPAPIDRDIRKHRARMLIDALTAAGHTVYWWATTFDHFHKRSRFSAPQTIVISKSLTIRLLHARGYGRNVSLARLKYNRSIAAAFAAEAPHAPQPDIIFCCLPTPELAEQSVRASAALGVPVIIDVRDIWPEVYLTSVPAKLRACARMLLSSHYQRVKDVVRTADCVTAVSETYLDWALGLGKRARRAQDMVFPLGFPTSSSDLPRPSQCAIDDYREARGIPPRSVVFSFAGTFGRSYDLATVITAALELGRVCKDEMHFVIAGDGDNANRLRPAAAKAANVSMLGWQDRQDLQRLLQMSDIGLAPYISSAKQSLPNKIYEYMAAGLPILSSLQGESCGLLAADNIGLTYLPGNVPSLIARIRWMADHPDLRRRMGERSLALFNQRFRAGYIYNSMAAHVTQLSAAARGQSG